MHLHLSAHSTNVKRGPQLKRSLHCERSVALDLFASTRYRLRLFDVPGFILAQARLLSSNLRDFLCSPNLPAPKSSAIVGPPLDPLLNEIRSRLKGCQHMQLVWCRLSRSLYSTWPVRLWNRSEGRRLGIACGRF